MSELIRRALNANLSRKDLLDELEAERAKVAALEEAATWQAEHTAALEKNWESLVDFARAERDEYRQEADKLHERLGNVACGGAWDAGVAEARVEAAEAEASSYGRRWALQRTALLEAEICLRRIRALDAGAVAEARQILRAALEAP